MPNISQQASPPLVQVRDLKMMYGSRVIQQNLNFEVNKGDIFFVVGGSGCGKTTLLHNMIGLITPAAGEVLYNGVNFYESDFDTQSALMKNWGITYQTGALFLSMTLGENVALPIQQYTDLSEKQISELVDYKLSLVGLAGYQDFYPAEMSGGMHKRGGLARAIALDPELLFFDEPSAGLDPISSQLLDQVIVQLCEALDATAIVVSHELPSILSIGTNSIFLDTDAKTMLDIGDPRVLLKESKNEKVRRFLTRSSKNDSVIKE
jgi:phospholipid/cholesterol/gamma-HCH transport system ATP-binding protein